MVAQRSTILPWWMRQNTIPVKRNERLLAGTGIIGNRAAVRAGPCGPHSHAICFGHDVVDLDSQVGKRAVQHGAILYSTFGTAWRSRRHLVVDKIGRQLPPYRFRVSLVHERFVVLQNEFLILLW